MHAPHHCPTCEHIRITDNNDVILSTKHGPLTHTRTRIHTLLHLFISVLWSFRSFVRFSVASRPSFGECCSSCRTVSAWTRSGTRDWISCRWSDWGSNWNSPATGTDSSTPAIFGRCCRSAIEWPGWRTATNSKQRLRWLSPAFWQPFVRASSRPNSNGFFCELSTWPLASNAGSHRSMCCRPLADRSRSVPADRWRGCTSRDWCWPTRRSWRRSWFRWSWAKGGRWWWWRPPRFRQSRRRLRRWVHRTLVLCRQPGCNSLGLIIKTSFKLRAYHNKTEISNAILCPIKSW